MCEYCRECDEAKGSTMYCPHCGARDGDVQRFGITIGQGPRAQGGRIPRVDVPTRRMASDEDYEIYTKDDDYE